MGPLGRLPKTTALIGPSPETANPIGRGVAGTPLRKPAAAPLTRGRVREGGSPGFEGLPHAGANGDRVCRAFPGAARANEPRPAPTPVPRYTPALARGGPGEPCRPEHSGKRSPVPAPTAAPTPRRSITRRTRPENITDAFPTRRSRRLSPSPPAPASLCLLFCVEGGGVGVYF